MTRLGKGKTLNVDKMQILGLLRKALLHTQQEAQVSYWVSCTYTMIILSMIILSPRREPETEAKMCNCGDQQVDYLTMPLP